MALSRCRVFAIASFVATAVVLVCAFAFVDIVGLVLRLFVPPTAPLAAAFSLGDYPLARCLDGSAAAYYLAPGAERAKFLIYHEGGGFCADVPDCAARARGSLGSTAADRRSMALVEPTFSTDAAANPLLHNFTKVYVRYCDGAYFSGGRHEVLHADGRPLYFRGRWITEALIEDLAARHGLAEATDVVLAGCSAGAIHIFAHLDQLAGLLRRAAGGRKPRVVGFPDSGFYMDLDVFTPLKRFVVRPDGQNATELLSPECRARHAGQEEKCLIASVTAGGLATPVFAWQSAYDQDQRTCEMAPACAASAECVNAYGRNLSDTLVAQLFPLRRPPGHGGGSKRARADGGGRGSRSWPPPRHAAYLDSCSRHCTDSNPRWWPGMVGERTDGLSPFQALAQWYGRGAGPAEGRRLWMQGKPFPCAGCCGASHL